MSTPAILALQDGTVFRGTSIGADGQTIGEVVFNTAMTGYQEILTDPSYCRQIVTLTYPHIGNTGTNSDDMESSKIHASGLIIRDSSMLTSSWRSERSFTDFLKQGDTVAIADIDTRKLTRIIREKGAQSGCIMTGDKPVEKAIEHARKFPGIAGMDLAKFVSTRDTYQWCHGTTFGKPQRIMSRRISTAGSQSCPPRPRPKKSCHCRPTAYFSPTVPATRNRVTMRSRRSASFSTRASRSLVSVSATSCWHSRAARGLRR